MKAPVRVLLVSTLVAVFVILVVLYRYDLLKVGSSASNNATSSTEQASTSSSAPEPASGTSGSVATSEQLANGKKLYETMTCILCHGATGTADSPTGQAMKATNLTTGQFKDNKTNLSAVQYIVKVIEEGIPGTGMASFKAQISNEKDRNDLAEYVHSLSEKK